MDEMFTEVDRKAIKTFHNALAQRCAGAPGSPSCPRCCMRLYCFSAPASVTPDMLHQVMGYLENDAAVVEQSHTGTAGREL